MKDGQQSRDVVESVEGVKRSLLGLAHEDEGSKPVPCVRIVPVLRVFVAAAADPIDLLGTSIISHGKATNIFIFTIITIYILLQKQLSDRYSHH